MRRDEGLEIANEVSIQEYSIGNLVVSVIFFFFLKQVKIIRKENETYAELQTHDYSLFSMLIHTQWNRKL